MNGFRSFFIGAILIGAAIARVPVARAEEPPRVVDSRLTIERFASSPEIVQPVSATCDRRGRLLVIESHTHFRPAGYEGPPHDRVRMLEDTDGDGRADRFTTYFEGTRASMDLALHPDGAIFLATRNEILRLIDADGDGQAERSQRIVYLDTPGDYPHNGLSGLAFDFRGNLWFGLGENLGAPYQLRGSDGTTISGEGEGGNVFRCAADGARLHRVATGFWNPFGIALDIYGRAFGVDNDPDAAPPCRLLHLVDGGDYGYAFRYGRSGRHVFQAWNGQLPGTLPMMSGTGEGPCEILSYESDGLPDEYRGELLVTSWADHRVERYSLTPRGASVAAERKAFVEGGSDFRPVGLAVAPDGSLFVSDWVLKDYQLHGRGAVWHVRARQPQASERPTSAEAAIGSPHRPVREGAARQLAADSEQGHPVLVRQLRSSDVRVRATAIEALATVRSGLAELRRLAHTDADPLLRALAVRSLAECGEDVSEFASPKNPAPVRREGLASFQGPGHLDRLLAIFEDPDPFLKSAAVLRLATQPELLATLPEGDGTPARRIGVLLAQRGSSSPSSGAWLRSASASSDPDLVLLAAKWIADLRPDGYRSLVEQGRYRAVADPRLYQAWSTALARLENREVNENEMAEYFLQRLVAPETPVELRIAALQSLPANHKKLTLELLGQLLTDSDPALQLEVVRLLGDHPDTRRWGQLRKLAENLDADPNLRAQALVGLAEQPELPVDLFLRLAQSGPPAVRVESLRGLVGVQLSTEQRQTLEQLVASDSEMAPLTNRILGRPFAANRPPLNAIDDWLTRLDGNADAAAGRRVFSHSKLAHCSRCHRINGRGQDIGPDLSGIWRTERRHLVQSILQPSQLVAPHYQVWALETDQGQSLTGMLVRTYLDEYTYVDPQGKLFTVKTGEVESTRPLSSSIMPESLPDLLTDQELRDLVAFLQLGDHRSSSSHRSHRP